MINRLSGILVDCELTEITVEINGVGYGLTVPLSTFDQLPPTGSAVTLFVHTHVREDAITLFGFATLEEKKLFRLLQTVSGIGNRLALNILSSISPASLAEHVANGNIAGLTKINGLGKKSSERLVVELRERIRGVVPEVAISPGEPGSGSLSSQAQDAIAALQTLGFKPESASQAIKEVYRRLPPEEHSSENLIRLALSRLNS